MKHFFIIAIAAIMLLSLAACGQKNDEKKGAGENAAVADLTNDEITDAADDEAADIETTASAKDQNINSEGSGSNDDDAAMINLDKLKEIEAADTFEVKATGKELVNDVAPEYTMGGNDAVYVTIENNSGKTITSITLLGTAHTEDGKLIDLGRSAFGDDDHISEHSFEELEIAPGASDKLELMCNASQISGVRLIVASYTTSDGETIENPTADEWFKNVVIGRTTVLD